MLIACNSSCSYGGYNQPHLPDILYMVSDYSLLYIMGPSASLFEGPIDWSYGGLTGGHTSSTSSLSSPAELQMGFRNSPSEKGRLFLRWWLIKCLRSLGKTLVSYHKQIFFSGFDGCAFGLTYEWRVVVLLLLVVSSSDPLPLRLLLNAWCKPSI